MTAPSRRDFLSTMVAAAVLPGAKLDLFSRRPRLPETRPLRVRTITAGVGLRSPTELQRVETAIAMLERAKRVFEGEDYEVQTLRIATPPLLAGSNDRSRDAALAQLRALDDLTEWDTHPLWIQATHPASPSLPVSADSLPASSTADSWRRRSARS